MFLYLGSSSSRSYPLMEKKQKTLQACARRCALENYFRRKAMEKRKKQFEDEEQRRRESILQRRKQTKLALKFQRPHVPFCTASSKKVSHRLSSSSNVRRSGLDGGAGDASTLLAHSRVQKWIKETYHYKQASEEQMMMLKDEERTDRQSLLQKEDMQEDPEHFQNGSHPPSCSTQSLTIEQALKNIGMSPSDEDVNSTSSINSSSPPTLEGPSGPHSQNVVFATNISSKVMQKDSVTHDKPTCPQIDQECHNSCISLCTLSKLENPSDTQNPTEIGPTTKPGFFWVDLNGESEEEPASMVQKNKAVRAFGHTFLVRTNSHQNLESSSSQASGNASGAHSQHEEVPVTCRQVDQERIRPSTLHNLEKEVPQHLSDSQNPKEPRPTTKPSFFWVDFNGETEEEPASVFQKTKALPTQYRRFLLHTNNHQKVQRCSSQSLGGASGQCGQNVVSEAELPSIIIQELPVKYHKSTCSQRWISPSALQKLENNVPQHSSDSHNPKQPESTTKPSFFWVDLNGETEEKPASVFQKTKATQACGRKFLVRTNSRQKMESSSSRISGSQHLGVPVKNPKLTRQADQVNCDPSISSAGSRFSLDSLDSTIPQNNQSGKPQEPPELQDSKRASSHSKVRSRPVHRGRKTRFISGVLEQFEKAVEEAKSTLSRLESQYKSEQECPEQHGTYKEQKRKQRTRALQRKLHYLTVKNSKAEPRKPT